MKTVRLAGIGDIAEGAAKTVSAEGREIALFNVGGCFHAIDNICPHRGGPLAEGHVEDGVVTCPWHAWQFNVTTGACLTVPASRQHAYKVRVEGNDVLVDLQD